MGWMSPSLVSSLNRRLPNLCTVRKGEELCTAQVCKCYFES